MLSPLPKPSRPSSGSRAATAALAPSAPAGGSDHDSGREPADDRSLTAPRAQLPRPESWSPREGVICTPLAPYRRVQSNAGAARLAYDPQGRLARAGDDQKLRLTDAGGLPLTDFRPAGHKWLHGSTSFAHTFGPATSLVWGTQAQKTDIIVGARRGGLVIFSDRSAKNHFGKLAFESQGQPAVVTWNPHTRQALQVFAHAAEGISTLVSLDIIHHRHRGGMRPCLREGGEERLTFAGPIQDLVWSPNAAVLLALTGSPVVYAIEGQALSKKERDRTPAQVLQFDSAVMQATFSPAGQLAVLRADDKIELRDPQAEQSGRGRVIRRAPQGPRPSHIAWFDDQRLAVAYTSLTADERAASLAHAPGECVLWNVQTDELLSVPLRSPAAALAKNPRKKELAITGADGITHLISFTAEMLP